MMTKTREKDLKSLKALMKNYSLTEVQLSNILGFAPDRITKIMSGAGVSKEERNVIYLALENKRYFEEFLEINKPYINRYVYERLEKEING